MRAAQNRRLTFAITYRAATVRERLLPILFRQASKQSRIALCLAPILLLGADKYASETRILSDSMHWKQGNVIAEIGAGEGQMSFLAAREVGATGRVYSTELNPAKLKHLTDEVKRRGLGNIEILQARAIDTALPANCCDDIFLRRVYHHFSDPKDTDASIYRALKPGALLAVIEFPPRPEYGSLDGMPKSHGGLHGIPQNVLVDELKAAGFEIVQPPEDMGIEGDYSVIARKPRLP